MRARRIRARHPVTKDQYILDGQGAILGRGRRRVAAVSEEIAERAGFALNRGRVRALACLFTIEAASEPGAPPIHENGLDRNHVLPPVFVTRGDVDKGFAEADLILEREYDLGRPTPAYMEPNVCVSQWDGNGKLTMWTSTQSAFMFRARLPKCSAYR